MNRIIKITSFISLSLLCTSCFVGMSSNHNFTYFDSQKKIAFEEKEKQIDEENIRLKKLKQKKIPKVVYTNQQIDSVGLFFEGEKFDFEYEKIGVIEVQGDRSSTDEDILKEIRVLALKRGCNAIINLKNGLIKREQGIIFQKDPYTEYTAIAYNGVAVKIIKNK
jgi:hypothetical protein